MKFIQSTLFSAIIVLFVFSNIQFTNQIKSNSRAGELLKTKMDLALLNKAQQDAFDIQKLHEKLNMVSAFFHSSDNHEQVHKENQFQFVQAKQLNGTNDTSSSNQSSQVQQVQQTQLSQQSTGSYIGVRGQSCSSYEDCEQKNQDFYKYIKQRLIGENAAFGEQGPQGEKGPRGLKGLTGPKGKDGEQPTDEQLMNLTRLIAQEELFKVAQGGFVQIEQFNNDYILDRLYYFSEQNCTAERNQYIQSCQADLFEDCSQQLNVVEQFHNCCPSQSCVQAIDNIGCCLNRIKLSLDQLEQFDLPLESTWLPLLKDIDVYQSQYKEQGRYNQNSILSSYKDRINSCQRLGFNVDSMQCSFKPGVNIQANQTAPLAPSSPMGH